MKKRVSDIIANILTDKGIKNIFLLSGGGMMHLLDGIALNNDLSLYYHHHEQSAGMAAEGFSRINGSVGVCYATSGPGSTNIVTSVAGSWIDSTPIIYITGQSKLEQTIKGSGISKLRQYGVFEVDTTEILKNITKFSHFVTKAEEVPYIIEKAIHIAKSGRPGPVHIDIPVDIQGSLLDYNGLKRFSSFEENIYPDITDISSLATKWQNAKRPLIVAGHGIRVSNTLKELNKLASVTNTPIVTTQLGKDIISYEDDSFIGHLGIKGDRAGNFAVQSADFILFLGTSLNVLTTGYEMDKFAPDAYKVQVDIDQEHFDREEVGINKKIYSDLDSFFKVILLECEGSNIGSDRFDNWFKNLTKLKRRFNIMSEGHQSEEGRINIYTALDTINKYSKNGDVVVTDAGSAFYTVGQAWHVKDMQRVITSGGLGAMGWALPAATGAATATKNNVLCITGDGSLQTNIHALSVISGYKLNVKVIVLNNSGYISIKNTQNNYFNGNLTGVDNNTGVYFPELNKVAESYGIKYIKINSLELLEESCSIMNSNESCILDILCNLNQPIIPTVSSKKNDDGSMMSMPLDEMYPFLSEETAMEIKELLN